MPAKMIAYSSNAREKLLRGVNALADAVDDGDVVYHVVTAAASSADPNYNTRNAADATTVSPTFTRFS